MTDAPKEPNVQSEREALTEQNEVIARAFHVEVAKLPAPMQRIIIDSLSRDESNSWKFFRSGWLAALASRPIPAQAGEREALLTDAFDCARAALLGPNGLTRAAIYAILGTLRERVGRG